MISPTKFIFFSPLLLFSLLSLKDCSGQTKIDPSEISGLRLVNYDDDTSTVNDVLFSGDQAKKVVILIDQFNCRDCVLELKRTMDSLGLTPIYIVGNCYSYTCRKGYLKEYFLDKKNVYFDFTADTIEINARANTKTPLFQIIDAHPSPSVLIIEKGKINCYPYKSVFQPGTTLLLKSFIDMID